MSNNDAQSSDASSNFLSGTNGLIVIILLATLVFERMITINPLVPLRKLIVIILLATLVFVIAAAIIKKVFFNTPEVTVPFQGHVVSYDNKALA